MLGPSPPVDLPPQVPASAPQQPRASALQVPIVWQHLLLLPAPMRLALPSCTCVGRKASLLLVAVTEPPPDGMLAAQHAAGARGAPQVTGETRSWPWSAPLRQRFVYGSRPLLSGA